MRALILVLAAASASVAKQEPESVRLRAALETLRASEPGSLAFEDAARRLPDLIASGSGWFVASGAYLAGRHGRKECLPALLEALASVNVNRSAPPADSTRSAILDALVVLEARVPTVLLTERLEERSLAETFLLLVREPMGEPVAADGLLALFDSAPLEARPRWAAACALVEARDARIARRLLTGTPWEIEVSVSSRGSSVHVSHGARGGAWGSAHALYPPRVTYELILPGDGEPLLPIRHERTEAERRASLPGTLSAAQRGALRVRLIDELLGQGGEVAERGLLARSEDVRLEWTGAQAFALALEERCAGLRERVERVARRLEGGGLLEDSRAALAGFALRVRLHDLRDEPHERLPDPPTLPGVVFEGPGPRPAPVK